MGAFRKQEDRLQGFLLPPSPSDWLEEGHLAWFVIDAVEQLDSQAMLKKLRTKRGRAHYKKRKSIVEPVFGWVKRVLGFRAFSVRGLRKVVGEWNLVCLALNLRRMAAKGLL